MSQQIQDKQLRLTGTYDSHDEKHQQSGNNHVKIDLLGNRIPSLRVRLPAFRYHKQSGPIRPVDAFSVDPPQEVHCHRSLLRGVGVRRGFLQTIALLQERDDIGDLVTSNANLNLKTALLQDLVAGVLMHPCILSEHVSTHRFSALKVLPSHRAERSPVGLQLVDAGLRILSQSVDGFHKINDKKVERHADEIDLRGGDVHRPDGAFYTRLRARSLLFSWVSLHGVSPRIS